MTDGPEHTPSHAPRGEAPRWAPLAGLAGLVVMLLFTAWFITTEPAAPWPDAVPPGTIFAAGPDRGPGDGGAGDAPPDDATTDAADASAP